MRPRFHADVDFNQKIVVGIRPQEPTADFLSAHDGVSSALPTRKFLALLRTPVES
jgi:hypothetical protein